jgi:glycosyltransferase involved in cell wall biosynthesis
MLVSVTIPTYNAAEYLREAIESVLAQTVQPDEIIVVDDGSTDHTKEVCASFGSKVKYFYQENDGIGGGGARAHANRIARGKWIAMLDHDDRWLPNKLEKQLQAAERFPEARAVVTSAQVIDADGKPIAQWDEKWGEPSGKVYQLLPRDAFHIQLGYPSFCPSSGMVRRDFLIEHAPKDLTKVGCGDWELWLSLARHSPTVVVEEPLTEYRVSSGQFASDKIRLAKALQKTLRQQRGRLHPNCVECRERFREGQIHIAQVEAVGARTCLDKFHSTARSGHMFRSLPFLWGALRAAPKEVLSPRRAISVLKTSVLASLKAVSPAH